MPPLPPLGPPPAASTIDAAAPAPRRKSLASPLPPQHDQSPPGRAPATDAALLHSAPARSRPTSDRRCLDNAGLRAARVDRAFAAAKSTDGNRPAASRSRSLPPKKSPAAPRRAYQRADPGNKRPGTRPSRQKWRPPPTPWIGRPSPADETPEAAAPTKSATAALSVILRRSSWFSDELLVGLDS